VLIFSIFYHPILVNNYFQFSSNLKVILYVTKLPWLSSFIPQYMYYTRRSAHVSYIYSPEFVVVACKKGRSLSLLQSTSILAIVIHPHFLMCPFHLFSTVLQNQTVTVGFHVIWLWFLSPFSILSILQSIFVLAIVVHLSFLMGFCHLLSTVLQNQTIIVLLVPYWLSIPFSFLKIKLQINDR